MKIVLAFSCALTAFAMQAPLRNDPKRPVEKIAHDLGIRTEGFVACFAVVQPAPRGTAPSDERVRANKKILLGCLQKANSAITNEKLDQVMDRYRPSER